MPTATFGGETLAGFDDIVWQFTAGTRPYMTTIQMMIEQADRIMEAIASTTDKKGNALVPMTLRIEGLEVQGLYPIGTAPGMDPYTKGIVIADARWLWSRKWIERSYNIRRRTGSMRFVGEGALVSQKLVPDIDYWAWSLKDGSPWTIDDILVDVLTELAVPAQFDIDRKTEIQDVELSGTGSDVMAELLSLIPGYACRCNENGRVVIYDQIGLGEFAAVEAARPIIVGTGYRTVVDRKILRPSAVHVLFDREIEVRFNWFEDSATGTTVRNPSTTQPPREFDNVLPVTDPSLVLANGRTVCMGTWITFDEALAAWADTQNGPLPPLLASHGGTLSIEHIRKYWLGAWGILVDLCRSIDAPQSDNGNILRNEDAIWMARISAVRRHWRQTFRIDPNWRAFYRSVHAWRVAIVDVENATRAPSQAYMRFMVMPSVRNLYHRRYEDGTDTGWCVDGYATDLADSIMSPAVVSVVDSDQGIVRVELRVALSGDEQAINPGAPESLPSIALRDMNQAQAITAVSRWWANSHLTLGHRMAVVLTLHQGAPNNMGRCHEEVRLPDDVKPLLGDGVEIGECKGPDIWVKVEPSPMTMARFAWRDDDRTEIEECFYTGAPPPEHLLLNGDHIKVIADAYAASIYSALLDHVEGIFSTPLNPNLQMAGSITSIEHRLSKSGLPTSSVVIPPSTVARDPWAMMPMNIRRILRSIASQD